MTIYFIYVAALALVGGYLLGDNITPKQKTNCMLATALFLILLMSLRYHIGFDYISYGTIYAEVQAQSFGEVFAANWTEPTFFIFTKLVSLIGLGYQQYLFIFNIIVVALLMYTISQHSQVWWISCMLYVAMQFAGTNMNFLRQSLAAIVILAGWGLLKKRKLWQFLLVVLFAMTIHTSAVIMILGMLVMLLPFNLPTLATLGGLTMIAYIFFDWFVGIATTLFPRYASYVGHDIYAGNNDFTYAMMPLIYCALTFCFAKPLIKRDKSNAMLLHSAYLTFVFTLFVTRMFIIERFALYFFVFSMILVPEIVVTCKDMYNSLSKEEKEKRLKKHEPPTHVVAMVVVVVISMGFLYWSGMAGTNKVYPYVSIFNSQDAIVDNWDYLQMIKQR